jgi:four helix bundle protein
MGDFRDLEVWRQATQLAVAIYRATLRFPSEERYGLTSQMRRSAISISSNIAEGAGRRATAEFRRFATIARGSLHELRSQAHVSRQLGFLGEGDWRELEERMDEISRMLLALIRSLSRTLDSRL